MKRIAITDERGKWFDEEKADEFEEGSIWNGSNHISMATRSQTEHERLYRTASGVWVLNSWSQWQGTLETYEIVGDEFAARWLVANGHDCDIMKEQIAALEV